MSLRANLYLLQEPFNHLVFENDRHTAVEHFRHFYVLEASLESLSPILRLLSLLNFLFGFDFDHNLLHDSLLPALLHDSLLEMKGIESLLNAFTVALLLTREERLKELLLLRLHFGEQTIDMVFLVCNALSGSIQVVLDHSDYLGYALVVHLGVDVLSIELL